MEHAPNYLPTGNLFFYFLWNENFITEFFSLNLVIPGVSDSPYGSPEYSISNTTTTLGHPQGTPVAPNCTNAYPTVKSDIVEASSYGYNNWSNSCYNNFPQYPPCAQTQYIPPVPGPLVVYPQVHSIVNQNQIHLHLHGAPDKLEQYLGGTDNPLMIGGLSTNTRTSSGLEVGIGPDPQQLGLIQETDTTDTEAQENRDGDPNNLLERPYWRTFSE